jgi:hypothetical protein
MINLYNETKNYFILIDGQGGNFAGQCIYESIGEVVEAFQGWAECDRYEDPKLINWTIGECLANWTLDLKWYDGKDFVDAPDKFIHHMINHKETYADANFLDDKEKMADFNLLTKDQFLKSYSYITPEEYENTKALINA